MRLTASRWAAIAASLALVLTALGCSFEFSIGGNSIDVSSMEKEITDGLTEQVGVAPEDVDCSEAEDADVEAGVTLECIGTAPAGDTFVIDVELTDDEGGFDWKVPQQQFEQSPGA